MHTALRPFDLFLLCLAILLWSGYYVAGKFALVAFPPFFLTFLRFALVAVVLLPFAGWPKMPFRQLVNLAFLLGVINFGLGLAALGWGLDVATAIIVSQLTVPLSCAVGAILLKDKMGRWRSLGLVIAMMGTVLVAGTPSASSNFFAFIAMLAASIGWAFANILMKKYGEVKIFPFWGALSLLAAIPLLMLSLLFETGQVVAFHAMTWKELGGVLYLAYGSTLGAYAIWSYLLHRYLASHITPPTMLTPFLSFALAWLFLDQKIQMLEIVAGLVTMTGVAIITFRKPRVAVLGKVELSHPVHPEEVEDKR